MGSEHDFSTRGSLLLRLRDLEDHEAWSDFVNLYAPMIFDWSLRHGLQESDAAEATQVVLFKIVAAIQEFNYQTERGRFRGWLRTVSSNVAKDLLRSHRKLGRGSGDTRVARQLAQISTPEAVHDLSQGIEKAYRKELLNAAEQRVQLRVKPRTWQAYQLAAIEQQPAVDVAKQLEMQVSDVYVSKSRIIKMLRQEIQILDPDLE